MRKDPRPRRHPTEAIAAAALGTALAVLAAYILYRPSLPPFENREALLVDPSGTMRQASTCEDLERLRTLIFKEARGSLSLAVFSLGDRSTAGEPLRKGLISRERKVRLLEQRGASDEQEGYRRQLAELCLAITPRNGSPIFQDTASVVRTFSEKECAESQRVCRVWIYTDGIEGSDRVLLEVLKSEASARKAKRTPRINNAHVDVIFCGLSSRSIRNGKWRVPSIAEVEAAFRPEFTHPERVRFEPVCAPYQVSPSDQRAESAVQKGGRHE